MQIKYPNYLPLQLHDKLPVELIDINKRINQLQVTARSILNKDIQMKEHAKDDKSKQLGQKLIDASSKHDLQTVKSLIYEGADVNYVRYTDSDCWYSGNTHTALYSAVHSNFEDQINYINVIEYLLLKGANPNFKARRGAWNHCTQYPLFSHVSQIINKIKKESEKIRFIEIFVKNGGNINQSEHHSRSKNWRAYDIRTCFVFQLMDSCGIRSKMQQLKKIVSPLDLYRLKQEKQKQLRILFNQQKGIQNANQINVNANINNNQLNNQTNKKENEDKSEQVKFLKRLIDLGVNQNSSRSSSYWQNQRSDYYQMGNDPESYKFDSSQDIEYETLLHRAIMHNLCQLVRFLIEKKADVNKKCVVSIQKPVYANQWPQSYKKRIIKQNEDSLKQNQKSKEDILQNIQKTVDENEKQKLKKSLEYYQFNIFKGQRFSIQNEPPRSVSQKIDLTCLQLAQKFKVDSQIIQCLKQSSTPQTPNNTKSQ